MKIKLDKLSNSRFLNFVFICGAFLFFISPVLTSAHATSLADSRLENMARSREMNLPTIKMADTRITITPHESLATRITVTPNDSLGALFDQNAQKVLVNKLISIVQKPIIGTYFRLFESGMVNYELYFTADYKVGPVVTVRGSSTPYEAVDVEINITLKLVDKTSGQVIWSNQGLNKKLQPKVELLKRDPYNFIEKVMKEDVMKFFMEYLAKFDDWSTISSDFLEIIISDTDGERLEGLRKIIVELSGVKSVELEFGNDHDNLATGIIKVKSNLSLTELWSQILPHLRNLGFQTYSSAGRTINLYSDVLGDVSIGSSGSSGRTVSYQELPFRGIRVNDKQTVSASGEGKSKDEAVKAAVRAAVAQVRGVYVASSSNVMYGEVTSSSTVSRIDGAVDSLAITREFRNGNDYGVDIEAVVSSFSYLNDKNQRIVQVKQMSRPAVVLDSEINLQIDSDLRSQLTTSVMEGSASSLISGPLKKTWFNIYKDNKDEKNTGIDCRVKFNVDYYVRNKKTKESRTGPVDMVEVEVDGSLTVLDEFSDEVLFEAERLHERNFHVRLFDLQRKPYDFLGRTLSGRIEAGLQEFLKRELEWINNGGPIDILIEGLEGRQVNSLANKIRDFLGVESALATIDGKNGRIRVVCIYNDARYLATELDKLFQEFNLSLKKQNRKIIEVIALPAQGTLPAQENQVIHNERLRAAGIAPFESRRAQEMEALRRAEEVVARRRAEEMEALQEAAARRRAEEMEALRSAEEAAARRRAEEAAAARRRAEREQEAAGIVKQAERIFLDFLGLEVAVADSLIKLQLNRQRTWRDKSEGEQFLQKRQSAFSSVWLELRKLSAFADTVPGKEYADGELQVFGMNMEEILRGGVSTGLE